MDRPFQFTQPGYYDEAVVMDDSQGRDQTVQSNQDIGSSSVFRGRSYSDGGGGSGTPAKSSPAPFTSEARSKMSKDDNHIRDTSLSRNPGSGPVTPRRPELPRGLTLPLALNQHSDHQPEHGSTTPLQSPAPAVFTKPAPLSPKLDHSHIYASPTNILPRRSRGLDFSRAATSLHHSTLAEQSSADSSPTVGAGRAMNIPARTNQDYGNAEQSSNSLWSVIGNHDRTTNISSSLGSANHLGSESSSSEDDDMMDEDMDDAFVTTPQINRTTGPIGVSGSPAINSLLSFQQRQRSRKQSKKKKTRGLPGLGFGPAAAAALSKSPPIVKDMSHPRRESISWQANQLHISGSEEERSGNDGFKQRHTIMRQVAARRGNLMPKTKNFARIKHALLEECAPVEAEVRREAEVIRQVRESDVDLEPRIPTALSSPNLANQDNLDDVPGDEMMAESGLSSSFKQQALKNSKGPKFWDTFSESSSIGTRTTPPPPPSALMPRGSSSGMSEDTNMDSPSLGATAGFVMASASGESAKGDVSAAGASQGVSQGSGWGWFGGPGQGPGSQVPPSAAEITRRINNKRRRDDDFDPNISKRRAVSPGMSVHNSPVIQSPLQRDGAPWGSRAGSTSGDRGGGSGAPSEAGSGSASLGAGTPGNTTTNNNSAALNNRLGGNKGRVGLQGMTDTHDGLMRMSIE
ncbi:hypothetical protein SODALDRAFT_335741 [Sodiomyces alkalinus F11]|uniref:Uncharacterized protein n=1 Tax=Sodiomyces alkalinus (strain CBS 110278 / VKM F-3762 / F11) TaxID=1314773 RepID=A0A3N2PQ86_SODAK|nr:hypothetical protein SODALDRAFT_335741 [Sodiomyces alkalinus F11]ROT36638.1 hypothetical protein SODALDRAFT_335741 [Sodiomyces alkalinus F11]